MALIASVADHCLLIAFKHAKRWPASVKKLILVYHASSYLDNNKMVLFQKEKL